jgi:L-ribulose-5-phosphate 3-epimerase
MKKGIVAGSVHACFSDRIGPERLFSTAREAGFDGVELQCRPGGDFDVDDPDEKLEAIRKAAEDAGIELPSLMPVQFDLVSNDAAVRQQGIDHVTRLADRMGILGIRSLLLVPGRVSPEVPYELAFERTIAALIELGPIAQEAGVELCIENVWNQFLYSPLEFADVIDRAASPAVRMYFDVGNFEFFTYPAQWIRYLGKRIAKVHVKDFDRNVTGRTAFRRLFEGTVDWPAVRQALVDTGYDDYLTAEVGNWRINPKAGLAETARKIGMIISGDL